MQKCANLYCNNPDVSMANSYDIVVFNLLNVASIFYILNKHRAKVPLKRNHSKNDWRNMKKRRAWNLNFIYYLCIHELNVFSLLNYTHSLIF